LLYAAILHANRKEWREALVDIGWRRPLDLSVPICRVIRRGKLNKRGAILNRDSSRVEATQLLLEGGRRSTKPIRPSSGRPVPLPSCIPRRKISEIPKLIIGTKPF
jgi:hypothetical protein